jgi:hypothetical protein
MRAGDVGTSAKTAWGNARDGAGAFGSSVKRFFTSLFSN